MMRKKTVVINTDYPLLKTGLGRNGRLLAEYLWKTDKYNIVYYSCGTQWDNPEYVRFPYKVVGTLPNNPQELDHLSKDPAQSRAASYGAFNIDRLIKEFKPDVLITSNDSWASQPYLSRYWWDKINVIPHITLDSLPFLDDQLKYLKSSKQFCVWSSFAEKEAKKLGFNHVRTLTGIIDSTNFNRLPEGKRKTLRVKNNIPLDAFICGFVFRNQLRKEVRPLIEGFSTFLRENPKADAYLLLHTHFSEPHGWNIPKFIQHYGVDPKRVLTTYICKSCNQYEVKSFQGQDLKCPHCHAEKNQITCNIVNGITETELNEVYNLMDCYAHLMNAGGLEMPIVEALYTELPLATVGYSSGEMFTDQEFTYPIKFTYSVQHETQFLRAVPIPDSVTKFLSKIYLMPANKRAELGKRGREWAEKTFSIDAVGKQWEDLIDSLPEVTWDFNFQSKLKNPNASLDDIFNNEDDILFIKECYKRILDMDVDKSDSGFTHWMNFLNQ